MARVTQRGRIALGIGGVVTVLAVLILFRIASEGNTTTVPLPSAPTSVTGIGTGSASQSIVPPADPSTEPKNDPFSDVSPQLQKLQSWGLPIFCGAGSKPLVALTFDDGPGVLSQETIDNLRARGAPATFFLVGKFMKTPEYIAIAKDEATTFDIGDHSQNHFGLAGASADTLQTEVAKPKRLIEKATGVAPLFFRPPWGSRDTALDRYVQDEGMIEVMWSLDSTDSATGTNTDRILKVIDDNVVAGDIVLLHENRGTTRTAVPEILDILQTKGLTPVTLSELLTQDPPTRHQVKAGTCS